MSPIANKVIKSINTENPFDDDDHGIGDEHYQSLVVKHISVLPIL